MDMKTKKSCLNRLARIEGQVRGVRNMVEQDRYCIDILTQINAARAALDKVEQEVLREHLQSCVSHAIHNGSFKECGQKIDELIKVLDGQQPANAWPSGHEYGRQARRQVNQYP